jgi:hypothetical protein
MLRLHVLLVLAALAFSAPAPAQAPAQRITGVVVTLQGQVLTLRSTGGETTQLRLTDGMRITARLPATWSQIATGSYVGTTAVPQPDGTLLAKEVHVFTAAQRGTGEGHYPMATPGDTMTNATVSKLAAAPARPRDTMTNATVAAQGSTGGGHRLTLTYKGGEKIVMVPDGVPLVASEPGDRSLLVPGAHVVAYAQRDADGGLAAQRLSVGKNGFDTPI